MQPFVLHFPHRSRIWNIRDLFIIKRDDNCDWSFSIASFEWLKTDCCLIILVTYQILWNEVVPFHEITAILTISRGWNISYPSINRSQYILSFAILHYWFMQKDLCRYNYGMNLPLVIVWQLSSTRYGIEYVKHCETYPY